MEFPFEPMLLTALTEPFDNADYLYEFKFDGVRMLGCNDGNKTLLFNRRLNARTHLYPEITAALRELPDGLVVDGEIISMDGQNQSFYKVLERDLVKSYNPHNNIPVNYVLFDILFHNGKDLRNLPLERRREILESLPVRKASPVSMSTAYRGIGTDLYKIAKESGLEGIVAKAANSVYEPGIRSKKWFKIKCMRNIDVVVGGFLIKNRPSLAIGIPGNPPLKYVGNVGNGLSMAEWENLIDRLRPDITNVNPFDAALPGVTDFVIPRVRLSVRYLESEPDGKLRQPIINRVY